MSDPVKPVIAMFGVDKEIEGPLARSLNACEIIRKPVDLDTLMAELTPVPNIIIVQKTGTEINDQELAQTLRMVYQEQVVYFLTKDKPTYNRKNLRKNGFTDAYLIPLEIHELAKDLEISVSIASKGGLKVFRPVKIIDLKPNDTLDFETSVYFPVNKKYIKVGAAGDTINEELVIKIANKHQNSLYVPLDQMKRFYEYSAEKLMELNDDAGMSETERQERLTTAIRELLTGMYRSDVTSFEEGQALMNDCKEIVKKLVLHSGSNNWAERVYQLIDDKENGYSHAGAVSTLAALFGMGLGIGKPDELALAGLLHDIGTAELPVEIQALPPEKLTPQQFDIYKTHPELSIKLIKERKINVSDMVAKTIVQHHEYFNGQGYPKGLYGDRIIKEAQVLAIADRFHYLTKVEEGKPVLSPKDALQKMIQAQAERPDAIHYNPEFLRKLLVLFSPQNEEKSGPDIAKAG